MMPDFIHYKIKMVYFTGVIEILVAIGLKIPSFRVLTASLLTIIFVLLQPININAAIKHVDYQKGTFEGKGTNYLWFRIPLQILFIVWAYVSSIKFRQQLKIANNKFKIDNPLTLNL